MRAARRRIAGVARSALDRLATDYVKLLTDPCGAPLVHPVYGGTDGSYLVRLESVFTLGNGAGDKAGVLQWTPGGYGSNGLHLIGGATTGGGVAVTAAPLTTLAPGYGYLPAQADTARCVAACMSVFYPGSELNRAGSLVLGQVTGSMIDTTASNTPTSLYPLFPDMFRTPDGAMEAVWTPNSNDMLWTDPSRATSQNELERKAALACVWQNLPDATGLTFKLTVVYEYTPSKLYGVTVPRFSQTSESSLEQVLGYIRRSGVKLVRNAAQAAAQGVVTGLMAGQGPGQRIHPNRIRYEL